MLPEAEQARKAIWNAINPHTGFRRIDEIFPIELREVTRENEMFIRFKSGSTWQVVGSDNYNSLLGSPPYGVVFSEWALADPSSWAYIRPILMENKGWALFITTPRGYNHARSMVEAAKHDPLWSDWFSEILTVDDTKLFTPLELEKEKAQYIADFGEEQGIALFEQEYYCSFESAILGAYYAGEIRKARTDGRVTSVPFIHDVPVNTFWDLGIDDSMSIWFAQDVGNEIHLIDYYELSGEGLAHYVKLLDSKRNELGYSYGRHVAPHDIKVRELGTGKSRWETAQDLGLLFEVGTKIEKKEDGHQAVRSIFSRLWFDQGRCQRGIDALSNYRKAYDETNKVFKGSPVHDWSCHGADAMQTLAIAHDRGSKAKMDWLEQAGRL